MTRTILTYGLLAGLFIGGVVSFTAITFEGQLMSGLGMAIGYLTMLIGFSLIFVAIKRRRDRELGGVIRFWPAFIIGLGISVVAGILYMLAWEFTMTITQGDFADTYAKAMVEADRARGASAAQIARTQAEMAHFKVQYANPLYRLPMTFMEIFPVGVLVSLIAAGLLRNPRFLATRGLA